jgi:hypothetical protein
LDPFLSTDYNLVDYDAYAQRLMVPTRDPPLLTGGAAVLDEVALAGVGPVAVQDQPKPHRGFQCLVHRLAEPATGAWSHPYDDEKAKSARLVMLTSRANFVLSVPMLYCMVTARLVG